MVYKNNLFFIALMIYMMVNTGDVNNQPGVLPVISNVNYTLEEVDLNVYYNEDEFEIIEVPSFVQVNLRGPQNVLRRFQFARSTYEVYIDVRNLGAGTHYVRVQHQGFPNELTVVTVPQTVVVKIEEKRTVSLPITIEMINEGQLKEGYTIETPIVNPSKVEITAASSVIEQIGGVKGIIDLTGATETINTSIPIKVYDINGIELDIPVNPAVVDVKVPIISPSKIIPLRIQTMEDLSEGLSVRTSSINPAEVTIFGPLNVINSINYLEIPINLSEISETTTLEIEVPVPTGIERISPEIVTVKIEIDVEEVIEFEDVEIAVIGLPERMKTTFKIPENKRININVKGSPEAIQSIEAADIKVYIDLDRYSVGTHLVPIQVTAPQNVSAIPTVKQAEVEITDSTDRENVIETEADR
ncbi:MAG: YbbR-like domain-containing protein [Bacillaceae bacterium]|nr:YbbR-like domain-containing protein [Bacillaceae bacterium]